MVDNLLPCARCPPEVCYVKRRKIKSHALSCLRAAVPAAVHDVVLAAEQVAEVGSNFLVDSSVVAVAVVGSPEQLVEYLGNHHKLKNIKLN